MRTLAEQEVVLGYDQEQRVLWASTTTRWVATRWQRSRYPVRVVSTYRDGTPASLGDPAPVGRLAPTMAPALQCEPPGRHQEGRF